MERVKRISANNVKTIAAAALLCLLLVCTAVMGAIGFKSALVSAEGEAGSAEWVEKYNRNIEDEITSLENSDLTGKSKIAISANGGWLTEFNEEVVVLDTSSRHQTIAAYTTAKASNEDSKNANDYAGNIGLYTVDDKFENTNGTYHAGLQIAIDNKDALLSFKIKHQSNIEWSFYARRGVLSDYYGQAYGNTTKVNEGGYQFRINQSGHSGNIRIARCYQDESDKWNSNVPVNSVWSTAPYNTYFKNNAADNDIITVTYGVVDNTDGTSATVYMKWYNETQDKLVFEYCENDSYGSKVQGYGNIKNGSVKNVFGIGFDTFAKDRIGKTTIGGAERPIVFDSDDGVEDITGGTEGELLSSVSLPSGYEWKNGNTLLKAGKNSYDAITTKTYEYYGQRTQEVTVPVSVTATAIDREAWAEEHNTNIEDMIPSLSDSDLTSGSKISIAGVSTYLDAFNDVKQISANTTLAAYTDKDETNDKNVNDYEGNIGLYVKANNGTNAGLQMIADGKDGLLSFKMKYRRGSEIRFFARRNNMNNWVGSIGAGGESGGYMFRVNAFGNNNVVRVDSYIHDGSTVNSTDWKLHVIGQKTLTTLMDDGDMIDVTYGIVDNIDGATTTVYMKIYDVTKDAVIYECCEIDEEASRVKGYNNVAAGTSKNVFAIVVCATADNTEFSTTIGGIERPIVVMTDAEVAGEYTEGDLLSSVTPPSGYTWKNPNTILSAGKNSYAANGSVSFTYYGGKQVNYSGECSVSVTANPINRAEWVEQYNRNIEDAITTLNDSDLTSRSKISIVGQGDAWVESFNTETKIGATRNQYVTAYTTAKTGTDDTKNANDYAGNIGMYTESKASAYNAAFNTSVHVSLGRNKDALLSFKLRYQSNVEWKLYARRDSMSSYGATEYSQQNQRSGYQFRINCFGTNKNVRVARCYTDNEGTFQSDKEVVSGLPMYNDTKFLNGKIADGDLITVTFGVVDNADGTSATVYMKWYNETTGAEVFEYCQTDPYASKLHRYDGVKNGTADNIFIIGSSSAPWKTTIAGVNAPISSEGAAYTVEDGEYTEGDLLSSVSLPSGYAWKNPVASIRQGTNEYDAVFTGTYYGGETYTQNCKVTVTAEAGEVYELKFVDENGVEVADSALIGVRVGKYTLPDANEITDPRGAFVGWFVGDKLCPAGYEIDVTEDMSVTVAEIEFGVSGAKMIKSGNSFAFCFEIEISTAQLEKLGSKAALKVSYGNSGEATVMQNNRFAQGNYTYVYASAEIARGDYNTEYAAMPYLTVNYDNGASENVYSQSDETFSVARAAKIALSATDISEQDKNYIASEYLDTVVELYREGEGNDAVFTVVTYQDGLERIRNYTVSNVSVNYDGGKYTVTLDVDIDTDSSVIPVTVYSGTHLSGDYSVERATVTSLTYADGIAHITFEA